VTSKLTLTVTKVSLKEIEELLNLSIKDIKIKTGNIAMGYIYVEYSNGAHVFLYKYNEQWYELPV